MLKHLMGMMAIAVAAMPIATQAACFNETEWKAAHVRIFQTDLQVAALECANVSGADRSADYNAFIAKFSDRLKANSKILTSHFQRVYGKAANRELDQFVTKVANDLSSRTMSDMAFCANSADFFKEALALEKPMLENAAINHLADHSAVGEMCPVKMVNTAEKKKTSTKKAG